MLGVTDTVYHRFVVAKRKPKKRDIATNKAQSKINIGTTKYEQVSNHSAMLNSSTPCNEMTSLGNQHLIITNAQQLLVECSDARTVTLKNATQCSCHDEEQYTLETDNMSGKTGFRAIPTKSQLASKGLESHQCHTHFCVKSISIT